MLLQEIGPIGSPSLSPEWIAGLIYTLLMVGLEYVPGFAKWWNDFRHKRGVVAFAGLVAVALTLAGHYLGAYDLNVGAFDFEVARRAFNVWLAYLGGGWLVWSLLEKAAENGYRFGLPRKKPL